jgi:cellulose synthase/poly-beta-1,6-N-acetylglucosamine synthase-like glycosyltransferase
MSARGAAFWTGAAGSAWVLGGYPLALSLLPRRRTTTAPWSPRVSIVVCAYRERERLAAKLAALRELDYPRELIEVIVAVDEDVPTAVAARAACPDAEVLFSPERLGKVSGLNRAVAHATGDVVLMTDANNVLTPETLRASIEHLADPGVWAVAGRRAERGSAYDRYEHVLRRLESRSGSTAGMSGECVVVRREHIPPWPANVVNDDLWLLCTLVRAGGRVVYEPRAGSVEERFAPAHELKRRSRIAAGRVQLSGELHDLPPAFLVRMLSHKFGRLALPFMLLATLGSSASLARRPGYRTALALQLAGYGIGVAGIAGRGRRGVGGPVPRAAAQFVLGNAAVAQGVVRGMRRAQDVCWEPVG